MHALTTAPPPFVEGAEPVMLTIEIGPWRPRQRITTVVETTPVAGLVIGPAARFDDELGQWGFTGTWNLLHAGSGLVVLSLPGIGLARLREVAVLLGQTGIDWTRSQPELATEDVRLARHQVARRAQAAAEQGCPLRLEETSWRQVPPSWAVTVLDGQGQVEDSYTTETSDAADELALLLGDELGLDETSTGDITVGRLTELEWQLHCARTGCGTALTGDDYLLSTPDRSWLIDLAQDEQWRQLDDRRWLCWSCNPQFRATR
ncbi:hypothetical protein F1721_24880 [Saccharopolyspora hirsuta]|uniref:Uncharacterized protein n=1 Tax=Saccharopolyspora hirsuta TaxID=1837 RepID=A0A5M7BQQ5_SACHI|nr:hypothetical protein [Saccharopolyspora hirsuta]KAA5829554.1 hypothetical protein F1721_24880 [Saccharopolyspora hirsuta]